MCHIDNIWIVLICDIHKLLCFNCLNFVLPFIIRGGADKSLG